MDSTLLTGPSSDAYQQHRPRLSDLARPVPDAVINVAPGYEVVVTRVVTQVANTLHKTSHSGGHDDDGRQAKTNASLACAVAQPRSQRLARLRLPVRNRPRRFTALCRLWRTDRRRKLPRPTGLRDLRRTTGLRLLRPHDNAHVLQGRRGVFHHLQGRLRSGRAGQLGGLPFVLRRRPGTGRHSARQRRLDQHGYILCVENAPARGTQPEYPQGMRCSAAR